MDVTAKVLFTDGTTASLPLTVNTCSDYLEIMLPKSMINQPAEYVSLVTEYFDAVDETDGFYVTNNHLTHFLEREDKTYDIGYCIMPLFGVKNKNGCFACIITNLWESHSITITHHHGVYSIAPRFILDGRLPEDDMVIRIYQLTGENAGYSDIAAIYREYKLADDCKLIRDRINPHLDYLLNAPEIRIRMGWKPAPPEITTQTRENEPPMHVAVSFHRVSQLMDACKRAGLNKAEFCLVGWNKSGHDGRWPEAFPVEEKLGGEKQLRALIHKANSLGYKIVCHTNATDCYEIADVFNDELPMRTRDGQWQTNAPWSGGRMFNMCPKSGDSYTYETLRQIKEIGFDGLHYIDVITCSPPRECFSSKHPCTRREFIDSMRRIAIRSKEIFGGFQSEGMFDYIQANCDQTLYVDFHMFNNIPPLCDENIPMWQLVYHGITLSNPVPETVNFAIKDWKRRLKFIEYGGHPALYIHSRFVDGKKRLNWMGDDDLKCDTDESFHKTVAAITRTMQEYTPLAELQLEKMLRHEAIAPDVYMVTYEKGARIICNYSKEEYLMEGKVVPSQDYIVLF